MSEDSLSPDSSGSTISEDSVSLESLDSRSTPAIESSAEYIASYVRQRIQGEMDENFTEGLRHSVESVDAVNMENSEHWSSEHESFGDGIKTVTQSGKCSPKDPLLCCETEIYNLPKRPSSFRSSTADGSGSDAASGCKAPGFDASQWQKKRKKEAKKSVAGKGFGEAIFFSDDIILKGKSFL